MHITNFVANGAIQTAFHETGKGEPFVLVHGFTGSKLDFHDQLEWFEDLRRSIAYDQRGHGESSNAGPYHFAQLVSDLIGFLDQIDVERCDLLGHSLGGMIAMRAVLEHPDRFRSLILMDTSAEPMEMGPNNIREKLNRVVTEQGGQALLGMMRTQPPSRAQQRGVDYLGEAEHWQRISVKLSQLDPGSFVALLAAQAAQAERVDLELVLAADVSGSMDAHEARLQRQGYRRALRHPALIRAITAGPRGKIAVTYVEWAGPQFQHTLVDWTVIKDAASARRFAANIRRSPLWARLPVH